MNKQCKRCKLWHQKHKMCGVEKKNLELLKLTCYQHKIDCYKYDVFWKHHGNHKAKTYGRNTKVKKSKHTIIENHFTKEESKGENKKQRNYKTNRK